MRTITLMENEHVTLWFYPGHNIVHHEMHGFPPSGVFREMLSMGAECLEQHQAKKWLSDDRDNTVVRPEDAEWGETVWGPRVIAAGFKYWAIVLPRKAVASLQMKRFRDQYAEQGVTVELFEELGPAMEWLKAAGMSFSPD